MTTFVSRLHSPLPFFSASSISRRISPLQKKTISTAQQAFRHFDKAWSYVGKSIAVTRHLLNAALRLYRADSSSYNIQTDQKILFTLSRLKLFALVSISLNLITIPLVLQKIGKSILWNDYEGIALATLSLSLIVTDVLDSTTTFVIGLIQTFVLTPIEWLDTAAFPLAIFLISVGSLSRTIRLVHLSQFLQQLDDEVAAKMKNKDLSASEKTNLLKKFLEEKLQSPDCRDSLKSELKIQINELKKTVLERHTNSKAVSLLCSLAQAIENKESLTEEHIEPISEILREIKRILQEEMWVQTAYLLTNMINTLAIILFFIPCPPALPFLFLALSFSSRIGLVAYQDTHQSRPPTLEPQAKLLLGSSLR